MDLDLDKSWQDFSWVAFDTETSGAFAVGYDVVEFGAVKWQNGREVDQLQFLIKPREPMSDFIIGIHGITNEMVAQAPNMASEISRIRDFFSGSIGMAHHAAFDMGFLAWEFARHQQSFPSEPVVCTSLLSRQLIHDSGNHRLQTLVKHLGIDGGSAHRALDDARSCLQVGLRCFEKMGASASLKSIIAKQGKSLIWPRFSLSSHVNPHFQIIIDAIHDRRNLQMLYGSDKSNREIKPLGIVRSLDGDYLQAICFRDHKSKRFYFDKIKDLL